MGKVHLFPPTEEKFAKARESQSEGKWQSLEGNALRRLVSTIMRDSNDAVTIQDFNGKILAWNRTAEKICGWTEDEALDMNVLKIIPKANRQEAMTVVDKLSRGEKVESFATKRINREGSLLDIWLTATALTDDNGKPTIFVTTERDITEHKQVDEALHESEAKYRSLIEQSNDAIYLLYDGRLEVTNRRFTELLSITSEEARTPDFNLMDFVAPRSRSLIEERRQMLERGELPPPYYEFFGLDKEGREFAVEASVKHIPYRDGIAVQGILRDISERKKLEEQLRQAIKMETIGRLAGGVAHDFNNLLTVIGGHAELALKSLDTRDPICEDLQEIQNAADRASDLTGQLLAFSRKQIQQTKVLNLNDIITALCKMLGRIIGEDINLVTIPDPNLRSVNADPGQIGQIIINLAVNARDAMPNGGELTIETQNVELDEEYASTHAGVIPGSYVMLAISDTGCGMTEEAKSQIFDPFFTTKKEGYGTGLGLSMVYGIVKQSGGNVWVYSELNMGTTLKIYLPMIAEEAKKFSLGEDILEMPRGTETVLVVEDEDGVRRLACRVLKQQGYNVSDADSGDKAFLMCQEMERQVDLVVTDVVMPTMGGEELVEKLRELWPNLKVLFMSGYTANGVTSRCVLDPDEPYLQKPFRPIDIAWKVRRVLDG